LGLQIYSKTINVPLIYRGIIFKDPENMEKHGFPFTYPGSPRRPLIQWVFGKNYYFSRDLFHQQFHGTIILMAFDLQDLIGRIRFLKTSSLHLKMDAWKTFSFPFGALLSGAKSLSKWVIYRWKVPRYPKNHGISSHWCPNWRSQTQTGGWILDLFFLIVFVSQF